MKTWACYWRAAALVSGSGVALVVFRFGDHGDKWTLIGLTLMLMGMAIANLGCSAKRSRSLELEYEAGYRAGYREGRRAPSMRLVAGEGRHGGIPKASVRDLAGHRATTRRTPQNTH